MAISHAEFFAAVADFEKAMLDAKRIAANQDYDAEDLEASIEEALQTFYTAVAAETDFTPA